MIATTIAVDLVAQGNTPPSSLTSNVISHIHFSSFTYFSFFTYFSSFDNYHHYYQKSNTENLSSYHQQRQQHCNHNDDNNGNANGNTNRVTLAPPHDSIISSSSATSTMPPPTTTGDIGGSAPGDDGSIQCVDLSLIPPCDACVWTIHAYDLMTLMLAVWAFHVLRRGGKRVHIITIIANATTATADIANANANITLTGHATSKPKQKKRRLPTCCRQFTQRLFAIS